MTEKKNFVLMGASGDLAFEKLYPALFRLYNSGVKFDKYLGFARSNIENFSQKLETELVQKFSQHDEIKSDDIKKFVDKWSYIKGENYGIEGVSELKRVIQSQSCENTYYLALPIVPNLIENLLEGFKSNQLIGQQDVFVFEKPFGRDYKSAQKLKGIIKNYLDDKQIWMVDHYIGKNMVRNIISLRFANPIFQAVWNKDYIDHIVIKALEAEGIKGRGKYYDGTGAIRDMVQNHLLQVMSLITMHTHRLAGDEFSDAKIDIFDAVRIFGNSSQDSIQIKQYLSYTNEPHTSPNSMTETYADLTFELADNNWKGVPINIVTGKKLEKKETYAEIYFKKNTKCIWGTECEDLEKNKLRIDIFPSQKVNLKVNSGFSPLRNLPKAVNLSFDLAGSVDKEKAFYSPYANVLHDIYNRDYIYGITLDEVLSSWRIIDEIMEYVDENRDNILEKY